VSSKNLPAVITGFLLLAIPLAALTDEDVITDGLDVDVRQSINERPQGRTYPGIDNVQDLGDGSTNDGGPPDVVVDPRDAALEDEKNLGPNAPGYIP
jgi:hypothetical protein